MAARVCLGAFAGAHGVRGLVKIKSFTAVPEDIAAYGPLSDEAGAERFRLSLKGSARGLLIAAVEGLGDREAAAALKGTRLYVERAALPEPEPEEFYQTDLVGLAAEERDGSVLGRVKAVGNHGAGDYLEIERSAAPDLIVPFHPGGGPEVDLAGGRLVVDPAALEEEETPDAASAASDGGEPPP